MVRTSKNRSIKANAPELPQHRYRTLELALRSSWPLERFVVPRNDGRFVHGAAFSYRPPFRPFRYHPNAARSPLKPIETASGC